MVRGVFVLLSRRSSEADLEYCIDDCGARTVIREGDAIPVGDEHPGALDRDDREASLLLYTSGTTGKPKVSSPTPGRPGRRAVAGAPARLPLRRSNARSCPLYHTMGIHSLLAMHVIGGCFVSQAQWDAVKPST